MKGAQVAARSRSAIAAAMPFSEPTALASARAVPAGNELPGQDREWSNVARGADRGQCDPRQIVAILRGTMRGP